MKFNCPHCNQALTADPSVAGQIVSCPACDKKFEIPADFAQQDAPEQQAAEASAPGTSPPGAPAAGAAPGRPTQAPKPRVKAKVAAKSRLCLLYTS
ncbi:MAG: hypothetical protein N2689_16490, partial [Verrucomicrobiae bacterium]|nr:hypothetical protein [Verrucomicrobiae bacterium]